MGTMSDTARHRNDTAQGSALLPFDLSQAQLAAAPVLASIDALVIEELSDDEDDAFAAALDS